MTGHSSVEILLNIYTHVSNQDKVDAVERISAYCKPDANQT